MKRKDGILQKVPIPAYWRTRDGRSIHVTKMDDRHLCNAMAMMERKFLDHFESKQLAWKELREHPLYLALLNEKARRDPQSLSLLDRLRVSKIPKPSGAFNDDALLDVDNDIPDEEEDDLLDLYVGLDPEDDL